MDVEHQEDTEDKCHGRCNNCEGQTNNAPPRVSDPPFALQASNLGRKGEVSVQLITNSDERDYDGV